MAYGKKKGIGNTVFDWHGGSQWWGGTKPKNEPRQELIWSSGNSGYGDGSNQSRGSGAKTAMVSLSLQTPEGDYVCRTGKVYNDKLSTIQDLDTSIIKLSTFDKDKGSLTVQNARAIVIKNLSNITAEIFITVHDWKNDGTTTTDVYNPLDVGGGGATPFRTMTMLLQGGEFLYLPNNRIISYSQNAQATFESGTNSAAGRVAKEPKDINSGNEYVLIHNFDGSTYFSGTDVQIAEDVAISELDINVQDGDWFKANDLIMVGSEVMRVQSVATNTLTVQRGLLGSAEVAHSDDDDIAFFFGNEHLPFDNGKCMTDQTGKFKQSGAFFGYGRTADKKIDGIVAGSVAIGPFYSEGGYLDWGLQNIKASDRTGLVASTTYTFHIVVDEFNAGGFDSVSSETAIAFTTDASDTTFAGSSNAVIPKIQARFDALFYDASSGLFNKKVTISLRNGDIRVQSLSNHSETIVGIGNVSGTSPFGVGRFPALASSVPSLQGSEHGGGTTDTIVYGVASSKPQETIDDPVTGKTIQNLNAFLLDDGNGNLLHNGTVAGSISYITGHCGFTHLPNAEFKIYANTLSAHSGGEKYLAQSFNTIQDLRARSVNTKADSKVELLLLG